MIGCQWKGPIHEVSQHETFCAHPKKSGADVMQSLVERDAINLEEKKRFNTLIDLLSYEKIIFNGEFPLIESWGSFTNFDVSTFKSLAFLLH